MPEEEAVERAKRDKEEGKSPSTQAGEFVREEIEHVREGKHGARSVQQAIAIGLSKARRAGVALPPPKGEQSSADVRERAARDLKRGKRPHAPSRRRSRAVKNALRKENKRSVSSSALSAQGRRSARRRGQAARKAAARRSVHTKGRQGLRQAARKAARTRRSRSHRG